MEGGCIHPLQLLQDFLKPSSIGGVRERFIMNNFIKMLIDSDTEFTKTKNHNGDMWIINVRESVWVYFSIEGDFRFMSPNAL